MFWSSAYCSTISYIIFGSRVPVLSRRMVLPVIANDRINSSSQTRCLLTLLQMNNRANLSQDGLRKSVCEECVSRCEECVSRRGRALRAQKQPTIQTRKSHFRFHPHWCFVLV